ncbi:DUF5931 domain-containing protein [Nocardioides sp. InS609-2]|uniref:MacS family sensor histidine kinase n=1 Tax=Nocardioides sp. InS609-2 TaxID=2760705 RepID=UPI0020C12D56|nr:DUF5931 domain-containing protein [Nocardioides sp. InS609-2]
MAPRRSSAAAVAVEDRLYAALAVLRVIVTLNLLLLTWWRRDNFDRPTAAAVLVLLLVLWTGFALWAYSSSARRTPPLLLVDLAVAIAALLATPWLKGDDFRATLPGFWIMGVLLAWAVHWRWQGGLVAGTALSVIDLVIRSDVSQATYGNTFLLMIGGPIVGYMCQSLQEMAAERDFAQRAAASAGERARLARAVHDGVLQVLALVQRRGTELGGEFADLGRLAGEQESSLRSLIRQQDTLVSESASTDLAVALEALGGPLVTVVTPGTAVPLPAYVVSEVVAATRACLDNVTVHVGPQAPAWVMLDAADDQVVVSVRDEGQGIAADRLATAETEGRLGVVASIRGRLEDLGGTAELSTGSWGTEWELAVPRPGGPT